MTTIGREVLTPYFMKTPTIIPPPLFKSTPFPVTYNPRPHYSFFWLNWWSPKLRNIMDLHRWSLGTLVPEGP